MLFSFESSKLNGVVLEERSSLCYPRSSERSKTDKTVITNPSRMTTQELGDHGEKFGEFRISQKGRHFGEADGFY